MNRIFWFTFFLIAANASRAQVLINEVCPANADVNYDTRYFNFSGWVELYNSGSSTVNISGYYISDKATQSTRYRIPSGYTISAKGYLLIWCDEMNNGLHTNFSLDSDGEEVVLSNAAGTLVDKVIFPQQYTNVSYGRLGSGGATWGYMTDPTPNANNGTTAALQILTKPEASSPGGRYSGRKQITVSYADAAATVRYTLNGDEPTKNATAYSGPIDISQTRTLKLKAFRDGYIPSPTETQTYFIGEHAFSLPVVSISTNGTYLWDNTIGIYTKGTNGTINHCQTSPNNWSQDWDRHAVFEYFDANGVRRLEQGVDIRIGGNCSRGFPQKSFVIKARDKYGSKTMDYRFFDTKTVDEFGGFILRNSGNDFNVTMFRDALMQSLIIGQMDIDYLAYQPTIFYLNGQYWGIQNLREKIDADYLETNYGLDKEDIDLVETYENALEGTAGAYQAYKNGLEAMDRSTPEAFAYIDEHIDVPGFINYLVTQIYYGNTDWPGNNMKFWRQRSTNGKFRWILWDTDFGFGLYDWSSTAYHPTLSFVTDTNGADWPNPPWSTLHIRMLLENPIFRARFVQTMNAAMNTTFATPRVVGMIDDFQNRLATEMPFHKTRWGGSVGDWNYQVQFLRNFAATRNSFMRQHMADFFGLGASVRVSITSQGAGTFKFNGIVADRPMVAEEYFAGLPFQVEAVPAPGFTFKQWKIKERVSTNVPMINASSAWKYFDQGTLPAADWQTTGFNDAAWAQGNAQLGYGDGDEQTVVSYGPNAANKYITTYFRQSFALADTVGFGQPTATVLFDDGVVVYVNGVEVYRHNLPAGAITHTTPASEAIPTENVYVPFTIPRNVLRPGVNVVAVEVHQNSGSSSDVSFDLTLRGVKIGAQTEYTTTMPVLADTAYTDLLMEATFEADPRAVHHLYINEINAIPTGVTDAAGEAEDWIELYNKGTEPVSLGGLFITDNLNQKRKHKIAAGTGDEMVLAPGDFKVLWADEETSQGADHVSFKLSADGEDVGLYQELDGVMIALDEATFDAQQSEGSFSRIPDGTGAWEFTARATPGATNELVLSVPEETPSAVYPNPVGKTLYIRSPGNVSEAMLIDSRGETVRAYHDVRQQSLGMDGIVPGLYLLRIKQGGQWRTVKIVKE